MWKNIKGYEEIYKISDTGEIWSKDRWCNHGGTHHGYVFELI